MTTEIINKGNTLKNKSQQQKQHKKIFLTYDPEIIYFEIRTSGRYSTMSTALRNAEISHQ